MWKLISSVLLLVCPLVCADYVFAVAEKKHRLEFNNPPDAGQTEAVALLKPELLRVKVANRLLVVSSRAISRQELQAQQQKLITKMELLLHYQQQFVYLLSLNSLEDALQNMAVLEKVPGVSYVQPDVLPMRTESEKAPSLLNTLYLNEQTFSVAEYLALEKIWPYSKGKGSRVAVIDTGVSLNLPDLRQTKLRFSWDIDLNIPGAVPEPNQKHGNKVAGLIWAQPDKVQNINKFSLGYAWGIAPDSELIALKLQRPWTSNLLRAFSLAEEQGADVINISWLLPWVAAPVRDYLQYLTYEARQGKGVVIIVAADPKFRTNVGLAALSELLVVSSTDHQGTLADASWGPAADIAAASYVLTVSQLPGRRYEMFAKTSSSAALVSGFVALLRSWRPELTAAEIQLLLSETGTAKIQKIPQGSEFSYKVLNAQKVLAELSNN